MEKCCAGIDNYFSRGYTIKAAYHKTDQREAKGKRTGLARRLGQSGWRRGEGRRGSVI